MKETVLVLGMHKSGTSLLANVLDLGGVFFGANKDLLEANFDNVFGFFEYKELVDLNDKILDTFGISWDSVENLPENWYEDAKIKDMLETGTSLISNLTAKSEIIGIKDPRVCITLPFWKEFIENPQYIFIYRNPLEVIESLKKRNKFTLEKSLSLWYSYNSICLNHLKDKEFMIVKYHDLLENVVPEGFRLLQFLGIKLNKEKLQELELLASESIRHSKFNDEDFLSSQEIDSKSKDLYKKIISLYAKQNEENPVKEIAVTLEKEVVKKIIDDKIKILDQIIWRKQSEINEYASHVKNLDQYVDGLQNKITSNESRIIEMEAEIREYKKLLESKRYRIFIFIMNKINPILKLVRK